MSEKHTPGPWFVDTDGDKTNDTHWGVVSKHNDLWVAACYRSGTTPRDEKSPEADAEAKANAALIARAPTLAAEVEELRAENDKLRAKLGNSPEPCAYCGIPADKLLDCQHGFPGCPRADDMVLCGHFGAAMETAKLREALAAERHKVKEQAAEVERLRAEAASFHMDYRMKCDEETKRLAVEVERLREENAELRRAIELRSPIAEVTVVRERNELLRKVAELREIVQESAALFRHYEKLHSDKGTVDSLRKAVVNAGIAARCEAALASTEGGA